MDHVSGTVPRAKRLGYLKRAQKTLSVKQCHHMHFANGTGSEELGEQTQLLEDEALRTEWEMNGPSAARFQELTPRFNPSEISRR